MKIRNQSNRNLSVRQTQSRYQTWPFENAGHYTDDGYNEEEKTGDSDESFSTHNSLLQLFLYEVCTA
jgi:hypothetical protein